MKTEGCFLSPVDDAQISSCNEQQNTNPNTKMFLLNLYHNATTIVASKKLIETFC